MTTLHLFRDDLPDVELRDDVPMTTSLEVARWAERNHFDVLRAIRSLECSPEFAARNFAGSLYADANGKNQPLFYMTRDGFVILAMGFTGRAAMRWKERFLAAFNAMERELLLRRRQDDAASPAAVAVESLGPVLDAALARVCAIARSIRGGVEAGLPRNPEHDTALREAQDEDGDDGGGSRGTAGIGSDTDAGGAGGGVGDGSVRGGA